MAGAPVTWENLWKAFVLLPGTARPRILLTAWEGLLGLLCWAGGRFAGDWGLLALGVAFVVHEVLFKAWVVYVVRIPDADDGDVVGTAHKAVLTLERWIGPVA